MLRITGLRGTYMVPGIELQWALCKENAPPIFYLFGLIVCYFENN